MNRRYLICTMATCTMFSLVSQISSVSADSIRRLVFIHGRDQQGNDPEELKANWISALQRGAETLGRKLPRDLEVRLPFYGDILDGYAKQFDIPLTSDIQTRGEGEVDQDFLQFQAAVAESIRKEKKITDNQIHVEYGNSPGERGPQNWRWVQAILRAIDKHSSGLSQAALERFTRDVYLYISRTSVRTSIDKIIQDDLTDQPTVIVSHSLGSVVAYSVLVRNQRAENVPLLITLGSPLAIRPIRDRLTPLKYPVPVSDWYNAFDTRDVVSLYPLNNANFPVGKPIENNPTVRNHTENRHGIDGYLNDPNVARRILDSLSG